MTEAPAPRIDGLSFIRTLGSGGYADVFLYRQAEPDREVAVKVVRDTTLSAIARERFRAEANAMAKLQGHRNIASVFGVGTTADNRPYIVMQYYPGASLAGSKRFSVQDVLSIGISIGSAVETAHRKGLLHRDIKPPNILTDEWNAPVLADFGIAAQHAAAEDDLGVSVPWSPPEILYDQAPPSPQSDVYSLAASLWTLLVGRSPFEVPGGDNGSRALMSRIKSLPPPKTGRPDVPGSLERLLNQAMAKDPQNRPRSAVDFSRWLQRIELELHLAPTKIEVADALPVDRGVSTETVVRPARQPEADPSQQVLPAGPRPAPSETKLRQPVRMPVFQPVGNAASSRHAPQPLADTSVPGVKPPVAATILRAPAVPDRPVEPVLERRTRRPIIVGGLAAVLVLIAIVVAIVVGDPFGANQVVGPTHDGRSSTPAIDDLVRPGPVKISARRLGARTVEFSWTYTEAKPDDTFKVWRDDRQPQVVTASKLRLTDAPGRTCLSVAVVRHDGSFAPISPPKPECVR